MPRDYGKRCRRHRKVRYMTRREAVRACERLTRRNLLGYARPYFEPRCDCWHITTKRKRWKR
jgi:hypothetical protein